MGASGGKARRSDDVTRDPDNLNRVSIAEQVASNTIFPAEISLGKSRIHDRNILAVRCVARGEKPSRTERYLQCLEIGWRHINQVGHVLIARLRAIGNFH